MTLITSLQNSHIKNAVRLRNNRFRTSSKQCLIEGYREIARATEVSYPIVTLFYSPHFFLGTNEHDLIDTLKQKQVLLLECTPEVFKKISYRDRPDGLLAIASQHLLSLENFTSSIFSTDSPLIVVAESIEKPGNLGTILRSCDAAGADGLIICDRCTDIFNPNVIRASIGNIFTVPVLELSQQETLDWIRTHHFNLIASSPSAKAPFTSLDMTVPTAIMVGTEQYGLSDFWLEQANEQVYIPMHGRTDSLNVAMATTLLLYESQRQRSIKNKH